MSPGGEGRGIVLICDPDGAVRTIVRDDLGLAGRVPPGSHVSDLVDPGVRDKMRLFVA